MKGKFIELIDYQNVWNQKKICCIFCNRSHNSKHIFDIKRVECPYCHKMTLVDFENVILFRKKESGNIR